MRWFEDWLDNLHVLVERGRREVVVADSLAPAYSLWCYLTVSAGTQTEHHPARWRRPRVRRSASSAPHGLPPSSPTVPRCTVGPLHAECPPGWMRSVDTMCALVSCVHLYISHSCTTNLTKTLKRRASISGNTLAYFQLYKIILPYFEIYSNDIHSIKNQDCLLTFSLIVFIYK